MTQQPVQHSRLHLGQGHVLREQAPRPAQRHIAKATPGITREPRAKRNYAKFVDLLLEKTDRPRVLVLGGSIEGQGMEPLLSNPNIELVETDVAFGPRAKMICDAKATLPYADGSFDGVVAQAVLEHVADPVPLRR